MTIKPPAHGKKLLIFGEILWDLLPDGAKPGGAPANVAVNTHRLGLDCALVSAVGDDARGRAMLARLRAHGFPADGIQQIAGKATGAVDITLSGAGIPSYHIREDAAWDYITDTPEARASAAEAGAFYFGSLAQRSARSRETLLALLALAPRGCLRFFDVNLRRPWPSVETVRESLARADVLKLNHEELPLMAEWLSLPGGGDEAAFADALAARWPVRVVLLTKGPRGAVIYEQDREAVAVPASPAGKIVDTVGAGDAFSAGFLAGRLRGLSYDEAARLGSDLAACVCETAGAWLPAGETVAASVVPDLVSDRASQTRLDTRSSRAPASASATQTSPDATLAKYLSPDLVASPTPAPTSPPPPPTSSSPTSSSPAGAPPAGTSPASPSASAPPPAPSDASAPSPAFSANVSPAPTSMPARPRSAPSPRPRSPSSAPI
jgi:fructokinase